MPLQRQQTGSHPVYIRSERSGGGQGARGVRRLSGAPLVATPNTLGRLTGPPPWATGSEILVTRCDRAAKKILLETIRLTASHSPRVARPFANRKQRASADRGQGGPALITAITFTILRDSLVACLASNLLLLIVVVIIAARQPLRGSRHWSHPAKLLADEVIENAASS